jgi:peptide/nickel transport system permease protein
VFLVVRLIPGDPARIMLGVYALHEDAWPRCAPSSGSTCRSGMQFGRFVGNIVQGDLGTSLFYRRDVMEVILERLPVTVSLLGLSVVMSVADLRAARHRRRRAPGHVGRSGGPRGLDLTLAMPGFWLGLNLLILFAVVYPIFPVAGFGRGFRAACGT